MPQIPPDKLHDWANSEDEDAAGGPDEVDENPEEEAAEGDMDEDEQLLAEAIERVEDGQVNQTIASLMGNYNPEQSKGEAPEWADPDLWTTAVGIADPEQNIDLLGADPWLVIAHVYLSLGGTNAGAEIDDAEYEGGASGDSEEESGDGEETEDAPTEEPPGGGEY